MQLVVPFGLKGMDRRRLADEVKRLIACVAARQDVARAGLRLDDVTVEEDGGRLVSAWFPYLGHAEDVSMGVALRAQSVGFKQGIILY